MIGSKNLNLTLAFELAKTNLQARYAGSILGFLWSIFHPFILFLTYFFAFKVILKAHWSNQDIGAFWLVIFFWHWLSQSLNDSTSLVLGSKHLLSKVPIKIETIAFASALANFFQFFIANLICMAVIGIMLGFVVNPFIYLAAILLTFCFILYLYGVLGVLNVFFRDIQHLVANFLTPLFLLSPAIYDLKDVPKETLIIVWLNPLTPFVSLVKSAFKEIGSIYFVTSLVLALFWIGVVLFIYRWIERKILRQLLDSL